MSIERLERSLQEAKEHAEKDGYALAFGYLEVAVQMYLNDLKGGDEIGKYKDVKKQDDFKG